MKLKFLPFIIGLFLFSAINFTACNNIFSDTTAEESQTQEEETKDSQNKKTGRVKIKVQAETQQVARSIIPIIDVANLTNITITGHKEGQNVTVGTYSNLTQLTNADIELDLGYWTLSITAENDGFGFSAEREVNIVLGSTATVNFTLSPITTGGGFSIPLEFTGTAAKVTYSLTQFTSGTSVDSGNLTISSNHVVCEKDFNHVISAGTYQVEISFYGDNEQTVLLNKYTPLVTVKNGFMSRPVDENNIPTTPHIDLNQMYSITYDNAGGSLVSGAVQVDKYSIRSSTITLPELEKTGYTFAGWYDESGATVTTIAAGSAGNVELTAQWIPIEYTITYNLNSGDPASTAHYTIEDTPVTLTTTSWTGHTFVNWFETNDFSTPAITEIPENSIGDRTYYAKWSADSYSITYNNTKAATNSNPVTYTIESATINLSTISAIGYVFNGWYNNVDSEGNGTGTLVSTIDNGSTGDKVLYAKWTPVTYTITYNNTKSVTNTNPVSYNIESATITLASLYATGYTFAGWYDGHDSEGNGSGTLVPSIPTGSTGDKTLYAKWTTDAYTITYNLNEGTNPAGTSTTYNITDTPITLPTPTKTGYTFGGWYTEGDDSGNVSGTMETSIPSGSTGDKIFYAKWTAENYSITYNRNGGTNPTGIKTSYKITDATITLPTPTKTGYTFGGWYTGGDDSGNVSGTKETSIPSGSTGDKTFYAKWTPIIYTITYNNTKDVTNSNPVSYTIESATITLSSLSEVGYTFNGWYTDVDSDGNGTGTKISTITSGGIGDKTFYARWTATPYTITYNWNGGGGWASGYTTAPTE